MVSVAAAAVKAATSLAGTVRLTGAATPPWGLINSGMKHQLSINIHRPGPRPRWSRELVDNTLFWNHLLEANCLGLTVGIRSFGCPGTRPSDGLKRLGNANLSQHGEDRCFSGNGERTGTVGEGESRVKKCHVRWDRSGARRGLSAAVRLVSQNGTYAQGKGGVNGWGLYSSGSRFASGR